jgi:hypothetical protein
MLKAVIKCPPSKYSEPEQLSSLHELVNNGLIIWVTKHKRLSTQIVALIILKSVNLAADAIQLGTD